MTSMAGSSKKLLPRGVEDVTSTPGMSLSVLPSEDCETTSTLQYVNSQLVAHGFVRCPGLSLDGLILEDSGRVVRCLLAMLGQRMEDLERTEQLGSKLRTLSYEHERLQSMHHSAVDTSANAEREMNLFKSKMAASQRMLASEVSAHKQTQSELQRTRTSLQYLRSTTQNELKRKEKELERVLDRFNKVSDAQIKLTGAYNGIRCANFVVGDEEYVKGKSLMEDALEQAEEARKELVKENEGFRSVILSTANALQGMAYDVKGLVADGHIEEPSPLSHTAVFAPPTSSLLHPDNAHAKLRELLAAFRDAVSGTSTLNSVSSAKVIESEEEVTKLKDLVKSLRDELNQAHQSSNTLAAQAQEVLDRFTIHASERLVSGQDPTPKEAAEISMELIGVLERDELRETLQRREEDLQIERAKFTEATVKLGKEKAVLEMERLALLEEKRRWAVNQMLAELPPTPGPDPDLVPSPLLSKATAKQTLVSPPRIRPRRVGGSKGPLKSPSKKMVLARHTSRGIAKPQPLSPKRQDERIDSESGEPVDAIHGPEAQEVKPSDTTENGLQRSTTPEDWPLITPAATVAAEMKTSLPLVLPTTFTLPPPSPASSLASLDLGSISPIASTSQPPPSSTVSGFDAIPLASTTHPPVPSVRPRIFPSPRTPRPLTSAHKKHAYSPARPSPLSRILMIADSPPSPPSASFVEAENVEDENATSLECPTNSLTDVLPKRYSARESKLAAPIHEQGLLWERTRVDLNGSVGVDKGISGTAEESKLINHEEKRFTAKEKGKSRATCVVNDLTTKEKENVATVTKASRTGKAKVAFSSNGGTVATKTKLSSVKSGTRHPPTTAKAKFKEPISRAASGTGLSSRSLKGPSDPPQSDTGMSDLAGGRTGSARGVPNGITNSGKLVVRRV